MKYLFMITLLIIASGASAQLRGSIEGLVMDKQSGELLQGATISTQNGAYLGSADSKGRFQITGVKEGEIKLLVTYVGYEDLLVTVTVHKDKTSTIECLMLPDAVKGAEVVVTASRYRETVLRAASDIQLIGPKEIAQSARFNVHEMMAGVLGVQFTRYGIDGITFNARGMNSAFNNRVMQLVDGRFSMSALSASLPIYSLNAGSFQKDDLERIEVVTGPQAALYGPNAQNAVVNFISRDPRVYTGTTVSGNLGNHQQVSLRLRHASVISKTLAFKVTGELAQGKEFIFHDSVRAGGGVFGPPVKIPERNVDFNFSHLRAEGHLYYSPQAGMDIILSGGGSKNNTIQVTTTGRNQMRNVTYHFLQAKFVARHFYGTVYNTWGNIGNSYPIGVYTTNYWNLTHRVPNPMPSDSAEAAALVPFKEVSQRLNADAQYKNKFERLGLMVIASMYYQRERPNGYGINLVDKNERITITQYGSALQLEKNLWYSFRLISALRVDHHSGFGNFFAPKFALTKAMGTHYFRVSWAKAYSMPSIQQQYAGVARLYFGNGGNGIQYIPNGTSVNNTATHQHTVPLVPEEASTWEIGYKATAWGKLFIDLTYYNGVTKNQISSPLRVNGRALTVNGIAVNPATPGTVDGNGILRNALFTANFNYGLVRVSGIDAGLNWQANKILNVAVKYSWIKSDITKGNIINDANKDGQITPNEKSLNAPTNQLFVQLGWSHLLKDRLVASLSARYVEQYDFYSGSQNASAEGEGTWGANFNWGPLGGFTTVDINLSYQLNANLSMGLVVTNLFNTKQLEMAGSPSIGRLMIGQASFHIPNKKKKKS